VIVSQYENIVADDRFSVNRQTSGGIAQCQGYAGTPQVP